MDSFGDEVFAALNEKRLALEARGRVLYNLSIGTPDFPPSRAVRTALAEAAMAPENWKYALRDTPELLQRRVMEQAEWILLPRAAEQVAFEIAREKESQE